MYNNILATLLRVERPLLAHRIEKMNQYLAKGINELRWNSQKINPFIKQAFVIISEVNEPVKKMKDNVNKIKQLIALWEKSLFDRKKKLSYLMSPLLNMKLTSYFVLK